MFAPSSTYRDMVRSSETAVLPCRGCSLSLFSNGSNTHRRSKHLSCAHPQMSFLKQFFRVLELSDDEEADGAPVHPEPATKRQRTECRSNADVATGSDCIPVSVDDTDCTESTPSRSSANSSDPSSFQSALYFNKLESAEACSGLAPEGMNARGEMLCFTMGHFVLCTFFTYSSG